MAVSTKVKLPNILFCILMLAVITGQNDGATIATTTTAATTAATTTTTTEAAPSSTSTTTVTSTTTSEASTTPRTTTTTAPVKTTTTTVAPPDQAKSTTTTTTTLKPSTTTTVASTTTTVGSSTTSSTTTTTPQTTTTTAEAKDFAADKPLVCSESKIIKCEKSFIGKYKSLNTHVYMTHNKEKLEDICKDYEEVKECLKPFKDNCTDLTRKALEGIGAFYEYTCGEGKEVYLSSMDCFAGSSLQFATSMCTEVHYITGYQNIVGGSGFTNYSGSFMTEMYAKHHQDHEDSHAKRGEHKADVCWETVYYVYCIQSAVRGVCPEGDAIKFADTATKAFLKPMYETLNCNLAIDPLVEGMDDTAAIMILVSICIVLFFVAMLVACFSKSQTQY